MMYTLYFLVAVATIDDKVVQREVLLTTKHASICFMNAKFAKQTLKPPKGVKFYFRCVPQERTDV